jgi:hypothetical protein
MRSRPQRQILGPAHHLGGCGGQHQVAQEELEATSAIESTWAVGSQGLAIFTDTIAFRWEP